MGILFLLQLKYIRNVSSRRNNELKIVLNFYYFWKIVITYSFIIMIAEVHQKVRTKITKTPQLLSILSVELIPSK